MMPVGRNRSTIRQDAEADRELVVGGQELHEALGLPLAGREVGHDLAEGVGDADLGKGDQEPAEDRAQRIAEAADDGRGEDRQQKLEIGEGLEDLSSP
jgi:hypothetical protein